jgi:hypothetical protein
MQVNVKHDLQRLGAAFDLYPRELMSAAVRAQNRVMTTVRRVAVNELHPQFAGLKKGSLRRQLKIATATARSPSASLEFSAKRFRLFGNFNARQTKSGVRLTRMPWRLETASGDAVSPASLAHAFIQRPRTGGAVNVWVRAGARRYPITSIVVSGLAAAFRDRHLGVGLVALGRARFAIEFRREAQFRLSQRSSLSQRVA